ncbi:molybdopterin-synthase adenylyltransferase MoeB [Opitutus terrae]|uniref:Molybdopterin-synthase adenylyltransferase n=1 Tax=Opitutus terrae (strain DSM 11246 / JCM 15787 / PB90-1) TaxID=452637 RepID=B1ZVE1_OPITP|nr:molybdopterin-synthase adenylyltransferase MoeB [Opitutus terrae]ACB76808.1 UBA/THIF-type NAD/FAD binding protein [Opitutus terrae PB90-1]
MPESLPELSPAELARYSRHLLLEQVGLAGQRRIAAARVLVIGAGGLGSPAGLYLAAAGIGTLGIADLDRVEAHNLQRQLLHDTASVGEPKVSSAARRLRGLNPHVRVVEHASGVTTENAPGLFANYDVIVDGTDNFDARYMNNDAAFHAGKPLVFGSVFKFEGQVAVFDPAHDGPCYRCLFPEPPASGSVPGCGEAGVLGALCGVIGSLQALETIKLVTGVGAPLRGKLLTYDALTQTFQTLALARNPSCPLCGDGAIAPAAQLPPRAPDAPREISAAEARHRLDTTPEQTLLLDVREPWETEIVRIAGAEHIPMRQVPARLSTLPKDRDLLVLCHHGSRSRQVSEFLRAQGFPRAINVAGGIAAWTDEVDPSLVRY